MTSPPDPGSPTDSASTSGTPPPEEAGSGSAQQESRSSALGLFQLANQITAKAFSGSSKRRNPSGGQGNTAAPARDSKLRRRGDASRPQWEGRGEAQPSRKERDELVDSSLVEALRAEIGDPFHDVAISKDSD